MPSEMQQKTSVFEPITMYLSEIGEDLFVFVFAFAFVFDDKLCVRYLIDIGADVNRKSVKGNTALHDCAESGSLEIMKLLIGSGAR